MEVYNTVGLVLEALKKLMQHEKFSVLASFEVV